MRKITFMLKKFDIYSIKKCSFGQKRPCVLHDFVLIGVFLQSRWGGGGWGGESLICMILILTSTELKVLESSVTSIKLKAIESSMISIKSNVLE